MNNSLEFYTFIIVEISIWEPSSGHPDKYAKWVHLTIPVSFFKEYGFYYSDTYNNGTKVVAETIKLKYISSKIIRLIGDCSDAFITFAQTCTIKNIIGIN